MTVNDRKVALFMNNANVECANGKKGRDAERISFGFASGKLSYPLLQTPAVITTFKQITGVVCSVHRWIEISLIFEWQVFYIHLLVCSCHVPGLNAIPDTARASSFDEVKSQILTFIFIFSTTASQVL